MLKNFQDLIVNQYESALRTVSNCVEQCPDSMWDEPVGVFPFSQSVFHALFFADLYLGLNIDVHDDQAFHKTHAESFSEHGQWDDDTPVRNYSREFIADYLMHCKEKVHAVIAAENETTLADKSGFIWLETTRAEVHVYNIRHIQHHAAQLVIKLRNEAKQPMGWVKSGWGQ